MAELNWRDASKELPDDDFTCLVCRKDKTFFVTSFRYGKWFGYAYDSVTHWLPIGEIPLPEE